MRQDLLMHKRSATASVAALALAIPFAGVALAGEDKGKGDERPQSAPGQQQKAEHAAPQSSHAASGNGYGAGKSEKPAKPAKPAENHKPARKDKPAKTDRPAKPAKAANPHAKAGKTTICHATGSATNPFVRITISNNALKAHARHQDDRDIIPAPAAGCPAGEPAPAATPEPPKDQGKVTICHATGSDTNPFVKITIAEAALDAHRRHQHGEDIIPAPEGDCVAPTASVTPPGPTTTTTTTTVVPPAAAAPVTGAPALLPAAAAPLPGGLPRGGVLGEFASGGAPAAAAPAGDVADAGAQGERRETGADAGVAASLPFTGLEAWLLVVAGLGLLLAGVAGRRVAAHRA